MRITKAKWLSLGGHRNSNLYRKQTKSGAWHYFMGATQ